MKTSRIIKLNPEMLIKLSEAKMIFGGNTQLNIDVEKEICVPQAVYETNPSEGYIKTEDPNNVDIAVPCQDYVTSVSEGGYTK